MPETNDPNEMQSRIDKLEEKLKSVGVDCELVYPEAPGVKHKNTVDFIIEKLKAPKS